MKLLEYKASCWIAIFWVKPGYRFIFLFWNLSNYLCWELVVWVQLYLSECNTKKIIYFR